MIIGLVFSGDYEKCDATDSVSENRVCVCGLYLVFFSYLKVMFLLYTELG